MLNQQQQNLRRLNTTLSYLDTHKAFWTSVPIVNTYRNHLAESIASIKEQLLLKNEKIDFGKITFQQIRIDIAEKMDVLDDILEAYAEDIADKNLLEEAENSKSDYLRLTNDGFERKVHSILQLLDDHKSALQKYGLETSQIDHVKKEFEAYQEKRKNPQLFNKISNQNHAIAPFIEEGIHACNKLDKIMVSFRTSNPKFYNGFKAIEIVKS